MAGSGLSNADDGSVRLSVLLSVSPGFPFSDMVFRVMMAQLGWNVRGILFWFRSAPNVIEEVFTFYTRVDNKPRIDSPLRKDDVRGTWNTALSAIREELILLVVCSLNTVTTMVSIDRWRR